MRRRCGPGQRRLRSGDTNRREAMREVDARGEFARGRLGLQEIREHGYKMDILYDQT